MTLPLVIPLVIYPGKMVLMRIPLSPTSLTSALVKPVKVRDVMSLSVDD